MHSEFHLDVWALWLALFFVIIFSMLFWKRSRLPQPRLRFSNLEEIKKGESSWKRKGVYFPRALSLMALGLFIIAFTDPHLLVPKNHLSSELQGKQEADKELRKVSLPTEGIGIYLVFDQSGSMSQPTFGADSLGSGLRKTKIEILKKVARQFILGDAEANLEGRWNDMIGLVAFARVPNVLAPLTLDHSLLLDHLYNLEVVKDPTKDGTAIGYAIFKTAHLIAATKYFGQELVKEGKPAYDMKTSIIVVVTDGLQRPNPEDKSNELRAMGLLEAAEYAKKEGIRVYIINVEPAILRPEFNYERKQLQEAAEKSHGKFYVADSTMTLMDVFHDIDKLEKSRLPQDLQLQASIESKGADETSENWQRVSFYPILLGLGMILLALSLVLNTTILRRVP